MTKVVTLSHVKASAAPRMSATSAARRIPWQGGKIVSNKEEALRKFYERKLNTGGEFNDLQIEALQKTLGITVGKGVAQGQSTVPATRGAHVRLLALCGTFYIINPKKHHATHRPHGKVQANTNKTIVINGRVVGPRVGHSSSSSKALAATRQAQHAVSSKLVKPASKFAKHKQSSNSNGASASATLALEDKLHLPLDALVGGGGSSSHKRMRK